MAVEGDGPSGQDGSETTDTGTRNGQTSDGGSSEGTSTGTGTEQFESNFGPERPRGRAAGGDPLGGLFAAEVKDEELRHVYVKPDGDYQQACQALLLYRVVVLQGKPGSGRHAMARHLLLHGLRIHHIKLERIKEIPADTKLGQLKPGQRRSGHILERCPPDPAHRLRADELRRDRATLEDWEGYLVVTVDDGVAVLEGEDSDQLVACVQVPDVKRVLRRHLKFYLRDRGGLREEDRAWLDGDNVRVHLTRHGELHETVRLAHRVAPIMARPPTPDRDRLLDNLLDVAEDPAPPETPEQQARRLLESSLDVEHWSHMIALAVFDGGRSQFVADAAGLLAKRLAPADPRVDSAWLPGPARDSASRGDGAGQSLRRMALIVPDHVPAWRPGLACTDWLEQAGGERYDDLEHVILFNRSPTPRVRFKDPDLRSAVLDHVWNELDELRGPVRDWLDELGDSPDPEVSEQTATAVAYLARHGLGYILELVIRPWMERGGRARDAAALALGVLARKDRRFTAPVLAQLSRWARRGDEAQRETAAMAYGLAIGQDEPAVALRELRALGMRDVTARPVAAALCELFRRSRHGEVLEALEEWTARPERVTWSPAEQHLHRTGLMAFLWTTGVYDEVPQWPSLLALSGDDAELRERVVVLWRRALADDVLGEAAGGRLCWWAREADVQAAAAGADPPLVGALADLAAGIAAGGPAHGGRVRLALTRCATAYDGPSAVARKLVDRLAEEERHARRHPV